MKTAGDLTEVTLSVPGIRCEACLNTIGLVVGRLEGAAIVEGDADEKTVTLAYNPQLASLREIEHALAEIGFPPEPARDEPGEQAEAARHPLLYVLLAVGLAGALATAGFYFGFKGFIYGVALPGAFGELGVLAVGAIAGTAAFFSPCVFPLLPAYVSYYLIASPEQQHERARGRLLRSLRPGTAAALGIVTVNLAIGGVIVSLGAASPFQPDVREDPPAILAIRFLAGLLIAAIGVRLLLGRGPGRRFLSRLASRASASGHTGGARGFFLYGLSYNAAGIGCTGPILLGVMLYYALVSDQAVLAFLTFTATMGLLMIGVTALVGLSQDALVLRLRNATHLIQRVGAITMVTLGVYTMLIQSFGPGRELFVQVFLRFLL